MHISSSEVYGFKKNYKQKSYDEDVKTLPQNSYAKAKLDAEKSYFKNPNRKIIENTIILRLFNVYGEGQTHKTIINDIISKLLINKKRIKLKNIYDERDYILNDVLDAIRYSLLSKNIFGIYNVSSGKVISVENIFKVIRDIMGKKEVELLDSNNLKYSNFSCGTNHKIWKKLVGNQNTPPLKVLRKILKKY